MATPVAHSLTATVVFLLIERRMPSWREGLLWLYVAAANLSDFDFLPGLLSGDMERFHRDASHSFVFAAICGVLVYSIARWRRADKPLRTGGLAAGLVGSHVVIDWLTRDPSPPMGVPALWPITEAHYTAPWHLFLNVERHGLDSLDVWLHNLLGATLEFGVLLPLLLLAWFWGHRYRTPR
ncbi:MAG: metal-dependent hydrolase [Gammaproteobacteria bacterium]|nr:metal-dependent hydrolase [Gammaproteobacteria bacterium]